jgi:hypothetical protein
LIAILLTVTSAGILANVYNRVLETTVACLLFVWAFALSLNVFQIPQEAHGIAYVLLGSLVYTPVGIYLNRSQKNREHFQPVPVFTIGYFLTAFAIVHSIFAGLAQISNLWFVAIVPLIATALYIFSASYFKTETYSDGWAWVSVLTFAITFRQLLTFFNIPEIYDAFAWACLAAGYVLIDQKLARSREDNTGRVERFWFNRFHLPIVAGVIGLSVLSLALTWNGTLAAFRGIHLKDYLSAIIAQAAVVIVAVASAWLYRRNWTLYLAPVLSFLPVTLFFIGYGEKLFGQPLTTPQYALAWTGLGLIHFLAASFTDRLKIRYAHPLYLGAYSLLTWSVMWSSSNVPRWCGSWACGSLRPLFRRC